MILTVTLNAAIDKRYVVDGFQVGEVNRGRAEKDSTSLNRHPSPEQM